MIDNISFFKGLSIDIYEGLLFLSTIDKDVETGVYIINPRVKAMVSEYSTKVVSEFGYEAHRKFIDIQYLITGEEKICCLPLEFLKEKKLYNEEQDAAFYEETSFKPHELLIGNGYFAIFSPKDGHMPQLCVNEPKMVKKVVVKVKIGE